MPARGGHAPHLPQPLDSRRFNTRARARRARKTLLAQTLARWFQHTCPREAGTLVSSLNLLYIFVSTHVPARGGHLPCRTQRHRRPRFNTRARARRAPPTEKDGAFFRGFNTRARARRAHGKSRRQQPQANRFNTRARARRALGQPVRGWLWGCFNTRARARRAPIKTTWVKVRHVVSTHVPARGGHPRRYP